MTEVAPPERRPRRRGGVFYGWWVVAASSVQGMFGNGTITSGFPIFFQPIRTELNVSYAAMSLVLGLGRAEGGMGGPLVGWLVDRFGARPMVLFGGLLAGIGLILLSRADAYWQFVLLFVGVVSVGKTAGLGQTLMAGVNQWFIRRRAVALSTLMTSFAGGGAIVVPLLGLGITFLGWRDTLLYTGIFVFLLTIPVSLIIRSRPEDMGTVPDGDVATTADTPGPRTSRTQPLVQDFSVREALRTSAFWLMLVGLVCRVSATNAIIIHMFPMLEDEGLSAGMAALFVSVIFWSAIPMRFGLGVAGGRISPRKMLFGGMNAGALGLLGLSLLDGFLGITVFIVGIAIVEGITSVNWIMVGDYFGRKRFASLMGFMSIFHNVGMLVAPFVAGRVRDLTGSYDLVLVGFAPIFVLSAVAFAMARRPRLPRAPARAPATAPGIGGGDEG